MKKKFLLLFFCLMSSVFCVGEAGAIFLLINPGSSAAGTGEAQVAKANDAYATYYNPAGLGFLNDREVVLQHVNWLPTSITGVFSILYFIFSLVSLHCTCAIVIELL